jgi:hypothetical protein
VVVKAVPNTAVREIHIMQPVLVVLVVVLLGEITQATMLELTEHPGKVIKVETPAHFQIPMQVVVVVVRALGVME